MHPRPRMSHAPINALTASTFSLTEKIWMSATTAARAGNMPTRPIFVTTLHFLDHHVPFSIVRKSFRQLRAVADAYNLFFKIAVARLYLSG